jgi:hypothetical protein
MGVVDRRRQLSSSLLVVARGLGQQASVVAPSGEPLEKCARRKEPGGAGQHELRERDGREPRQAGEAEVKQHGETDGAADEDTQQHEELSDATHVRLTLERNDVVGRTDV